MNEQQKREAEEHAAKMRELLTAYMEGHDPCVDEIVEIAALNPVETDEMYALWNQTKSHDGCISEDDAVRLTLYLWQGNVRVVKPENLGMNAFFNQIDDDLPPKKWSCNYCNHDLKRVIAHLQRRMKASISTPSLTLLYRINLPSRRPVAHGLRSNSPVPSADLPAVMRKASATRQPVMVVHPASRTGGNTDVRTTAAILRHGLHPVGASNRGPN